MSSVTANPNCFISNAFYCMEKGNETLVNGLKLAEEVRGPGIGMAGGALAVIIGTVTLVANILFVVIAGLPSLCLLAAKALNDTDLELLSNIHFGCLLGLMEIGAGLAAIVSGGYMGVHATLDSAKP